MYRKNVSGQFIGFQMLLTATGAIATGLSPTVRRCIDGTFAAGGGTVTEDTGTGGYKYAMSQADTNGNDISFWFSAATAMPVCVNIVTTAADPTVGTNFGLSAIPTANPGAANGLLIAGTNAPVTITGSGDALTLTSTGANGSGINATGNGTGDGIRGTGGASAGGDGIQATAGGGVDIRGNITGNVTGNLSGSAGSVTGSVGSVTGLTTTTIAAAIFATAVETSMTFLQYLRGSGAVLLGKISGGATTTNTFRNAVDDTKDRVIATVDSGGDRTAITYDFT